MTSNKKLQNVERVLGKMAEQGIIYEHAKSGELSYSLTGRGEHQAAGFIMRNRGARLLLLQYHMRYSNSGFIEAVKDIAVWMKADFQINLFKDIVEAIKAGEVKGIKIVNEKDFLALYDELDISEWKGKKVRA